jgi:hypothetical protein
MITTKSSTKDKYLSVSEDTGMSPVELYGISTRSEVNFKPEVAGGESITIDANFWLPFAAEHYQISRNLSDYIMVPVPSVITEFPNTNGDCVSREEMLRFIPDRGMLAYRTFKGQPTHLEHSNQDITQAKGVILDVYLRQLKGYGNNKHFKLIKLLAFDRTKDATLCNQILDGTINTYSMGLYFDAYSCSLCNIKVGKGYGRPCGHTKLKQQTYVGQGGKLVYRNMHNIVGFETSAVADPAYVVAQSDIILNR